MFTDREWEMLAGLPEEDLVSLAVELDIVAPEQIDARALLERCLVSMLERATTEHLPFSKYDQDDLAALPPDQLAAIARLQGTPANVPAIMKVGRTVFKAMEKRKAGNAIALMLPLLLSPLARAAIALDASKR
jgi:hypothetical protein